MFIRPMREPDIAAASLVGREALGLGEAWALRWRERATHLLRHDPDGCRVADDDGRLCGVVLSLRRDKLWALSAYFVRPDRQGEGIGAALLDAALGYSQGCLRGILVSTGSPAAARRYRLAGFSLHPTIRVSGAVDRASLPVVDGVRAGSAGDLDLCDSLDRRLRGAARTVDHAFLARDHALLVCDTLTGSGYCYVDAGGSPALLAASTRRIAQRLLWAALARSPDGGTVHVNHLTAAQEWAVDVALAAGLTLRTEGYVALRHMRPPEPYVPHTAFL